MRPRFGKLSIAGLSIAVAGASAPAQPLSVHDGHTYSQAALLARRHGYGGSASGGAGGSVVVVRSDADSGPGSLRAAVERNKGPVWVEFARDMQIPLHSLVRPGSNITIDGRGHRVTLLYNGLALFGSHNVIITNLAIDGRFTGISQAINIARGAQDIWIDHVDLSRFNDRLMNVKTGSNNVTVSWCKFHDHNKVMLLNNSTDENPYKYYSRDSNSHVTLDHNWFYNTVQRNPRAAFGVYHLYNNLLEDWDFYGMSFSLAARALVEGNIFSNRADRPCTEPPSFRTVEGIERNYCAGIKTAGERAELANGAADAKRVGATKERFAFGPDETAMAYLKVRDNLYLGDAKAGIQDYRPERVPPPPYRYTLERPSVALAARIRLHAGNTLL